MFVESGAENNREVRANLQHHFCQDIAGHARKFATPFKSALPLGILQKIIVQKNFIPVPEPKPSLLLIPELFTDIHQSKYNQQHKVLKVIMERFPFTEKKFTALSEKGRHRWLITWLSQCYQSLLTGRVSRPAIEQFFTAYLTALTWMNAPPVPRPETIETRPWLTFISDAVHRHRKSLGILPKDYDLLPGLKHGDNRPKETARPPLDYHIALDGLRSLFNVGSVFRTCDGAGFGSVILGNIPGPEHPAVKKTAMGAGEWTAHTKTDDLAGTLLEMKDSGYPIIGIETVKGSISYDAYPWPDKGILVFGNEEYGMASHVMAVCDSFVHIPMYGKKNSINVACAVSVMAFHVTSILKTT